eukprot:GFYU01043111.1.p1 GENE.GFYU01043111.1~~GFYU01043111.1.p1  ORF type:complete len:155 (-),score=9.22 GFYU01043111.1:288-752(-)
MVWVALPGIVTALAFITLGITFPILRYCCQLCGGSEPSATRPIPFCFWTPDPYRRFRKYKPNHVALVKLILICSCFIVLGGVPIGYVGNGEVSFGIKQFVDITVSTGEKTVIVAEVHNSWIHVFNEDCVSMFLKGVECVRNCPWCPCWIWMDAL